MYNRYWRKSAPDASAKVCTKDGVWHDRKIGTPAGCAARGKGRGKWARKIDLVPHAAEPGYTAEQCAALCVSDPACAAFAYQDERPIVNPNICVTYSDDNHADKTSPPALLFAFFVCRPSTTAEPA